VVVGYKGDAAAITRLLPDGTLDPDVAVQPVTFKFSQSSYISAVAQQPDGKLVVAGYTDSAGVENDDFAVARLRTDLTLDPTFNGTGKNIFAFDRGGYNVDEAYAVAIRPDGKIVVAGFAQTASDEADLAVARLKPDGTLDDMFGMQGRASFDLGRHHNDVANAVKVDTAGHIWVAGYRQYDGNDLDFIAARLLDDGSGFDSGFCATHFDLPGGDKGDAAEDLLLQSDGKIVLVGYANTAPDSAAFAVERLWPDCRFDATFGNAGQLTGSFHDPSTSVAYAAAFGGSGIVLGGITKEGQIAQQGYQFGVAQLRLDLIFTDTFEH
jgi:uncharacterized delta-60 repeat protein